MEHLLQLSNSPPSPQPKKIKKSFLKPSIFLADFFLFLMQEIFHREQDCVTKLKRITKLKLREPPDLFHTQFLGS